MRLIGIIPKVDQILDGEVPVTGDAAPIPIQVEVQISGRSEILVISPPAAAELVERLAGYLRTRGAA